MLKNFLKVTLVVGTAVAALSLQANAQTVQLNIIGSSAFFLEAGLGTHSSTGLNAPCVWSENTNTVSAKDTSVTPNATDKGSAWVAWTTGTGGSCAAPASDSKIYAYLSTDSVVGNRCLFNGTTCTISYPVNTPASAGLILGTGGTCGSTGECSLPNLPVAAKLNTFAKANVAGTDIRPEDAEFAITRALATSTIHCGDPIVTGSQYLDLGYSNGETINSAIPLSTKSFNVVNFSLPSGGYNVALVGATAVLVAVHGDGTSKGFITGTPGSQNITSQNLAYYLDGTTNTTNAATSPAAANVLLREPLSGTYNTMEYNVPNRIGTFTPPTAFGTSQDVGKNQATGQRNCMLSGGVEVANPTLKFTAANGGERLRAIGTGEELAQVGAFKNGNAANNNNNLGYGFWSVANYASLGGVTNTVFYEVDGIDPLDSNAMGCGYTGTIPTNSTNALKCVSMAHVADGTYPVWSLLRLVNTDTSINNTVASLASAAQNFVSFGTTTSRPDFIVPASMTVVREHFIPPAGTGYPTTAANGDWQLGDGSSACTANESGGDVGGVVVSLTADSTWCTTHTTNGQTGSRR